MQSVFLEHPAKPEIIKFIEGTKSFLTPTVDELKHVFGIKIAFASTSFALSRNFQCSLLSHIAERNGCEQRNQMKLNGF